MLLEEVNRIDRMCLPDRTTTPVIPAGFAKSEHFPRMWNRLRHCYMGTLRLESARPWLLHVVRHTCYAWLKENRPAERSSWTTRTKHGVISPPRRSNEPPALAIRKADGQQINEYCPRITSASMRNSTSLPSLDSTPLLNLSPVGNGLLLGLGHLLDAGGCERRGSRAT